MGNDDITVKILQGLREDMQGMRSEMRGIRDDMQGVREDIQKTNAENALRFGAIKLVMKDLARAVQDITCRSSF
jgi:uncharacterized protein YoxC